MTAEIALMNKEAIALATDSAVTINTGSGRKIYNTVNKLFALTKAAPIGIMVYGRSDFMGVPWESIIKEYRSKGAQTHFNELERHVTDFVAFLNRSKRLFPTEQQDRYFSGAISWSFRHIREVAERDIESIIKTKGKVSPSEIEAALDRAIDGRLKFLESRRLLAGASRSLIKRMKAKHASTINEIRNAIFQKLPVSRGAPAKLVAIAVETCCKKVFQASDSGVVIAGFGREEIFPRLFSMVFGGITFNLLRYDVTQRYYIERSNPALVIPFAQSEMVETFMEGIDPNCKHVIRSYLDSIFQQYPLDILKLISALGPTQKASLTTKLQNVGQEILNDFHSKLGEYQAKYHIAPVVSAVEVLPKDLLAEVAESLVNLTSFKRRISMDSAETVGGPIDVAVISKGDGFIWIKRKHYFKAELNPQFLSKYYGGRDVSKS